MQMTGKTFLLFVILLAILERIWKYKCIEHFLSRQPPSPVKSSVSIIQPIISGDPTMWAALEENLKAKSSYDPDFIWVLDSGDNAAHSGCTRLKEAYPHKRIEILSLEPAPSGFSPKTFKLIEGFKKSSSHIVVALDDDTVLPDWGLDKSLPYLQNDDVGVVFAVPYYKSFQNLWSSLVSAFVNANSTWIYIPYTYFVEPFAINGMFFALRQEVYKRIGGFEGLEGWICDDYALAQRLMEAKLKLVEAPLTHPIYIHLESFKSYWQIIKRWFVFTKASVMTASAKNLLAFYLLIFIPSFLPLFLLLILLLNCIFWQDILLLLASTTYFAVYLYLLSLVNCKFLSSATPPWALALLLLSNLISPFQAILTLISNNEVVWRGKLLKISPEGRFALLERAKKKEPAGG